MLLLGILATIECSSKPPKPQIVYVHRKHPKKSADTIPLGPPAILEDDPVVIYARRFVRAMIDDDQSTYEAMISPEWLEKESLGLDTFMISRLDLVEMPAHSSYTITDRQNNVVTVVVHRDSVHGVGLAARISHENGQYYVVPSGADECCGSIDPWYSPPDPHLTKRGRIRNALGGVSRVHPDFKESSPMVTCARLFVRAMLNNDQKRAARMLSPRWLNKNGISVGTFVVSRLRVAECPPGTPFKVVNVSGHVISVQTAPDSDHGQRLSVKTSYENGRYYVEPSVADYSRRSIDPWTSPAEH
jgi:hypothetical protein